MFNQLDKLDCYTLALLICGCWVRIHGYITTSWVMFAFSLCFFIIQICVANYNPETENQKPETKKEDATKTSNP